MFDKHLNIKNVIDIFIKLIFKTISRKYIMHLYFLLGLHFIIRLHFLIRLHFIIRLHFLIKLHFLLGLYFIIRLDFLIRLHNKTNQRNFLGPSLIILFEI